MIPSPLTSVCVFCGSSAGARDEYIAAAAAFGHLVAERGLTLVYGGASVGLMGAIADAALAAGGEVIGVLPRHLAAKEISHHGLTRLDLVETMHERKARMAELSDAFVALPGGLGTLEELFERVIGPRHPSPWSWTTTWSSALLYTLAFNVTFFIQELFLVVPKALTPGLQPTLYHNNHGWEGDHPLAELFQGTGALAILVGAALCALLLRRTRPQPAVTLFLIWMTFHGSVQALLQVVVAAVHPGSDVGRAFAYLGLDDGVKMTAALLALIALPTIARGVTWLLLSLADARDDTADAPARARFIARMATVPSLLAVVPIIAFRVPRELVEVVAPPLVVTVVGMAWMQAWSWHAGEFKAYGGVASLTVAAPLGAVLALLLFFQLVLRPGVRFY